MFLIKIDAVLQDTITKRRISIECGTLQTNSSKKRVSKFIMYIEPIVHIKQKVQRLLMKTSGDTIFLHYIYPTILGTSAFNYGMVCQSQTWCHISFTFFFSFSLSCTWSEHDGFGMNSNILNRWWNVRKILLSHDTHRLNCIDSFYL